MSKLKVRSLLLVLALIAAACSSATDVASDSQNGESADETEVVAVEEEPAVEEGVVEEESVVEVPDTAPEITAGTTTTGMVEIDGVAIDYAVTVPADFEVGSEAPLLLAFPPGGQDLGITENLVAATYGPEARRLGWVVVSPAATANGLFFDGSEDLVPGFLNWVESWVTPEGGAPHVAGISNGGISSFRYSALNPDRLQSLITFPGFPRSGEDRAALEQFVDIPVRMFVGGLDEAWISPAEETEVALNDLGGDVELTIFPGEGHVMDSMRDGTVVFELLESFRSA